MPREHDTLPPSLSKAYVSALLYGRELPPTPDDEKLGAVYRMAVGDGEGMIELTIYPGIQSVNVCSEGFMVEMTDCTFVGRNAGRLRMEKVLGAERAVLEIAPDGAVLFAREAVEDSEDRGLPDLPHRRHRAETETDRITVQGRLGADPRFRTTAKSGDLVGSFPLGTHPDVETTTWYTVVVFGDRAKRLQEKGLKKGQPVEVVGYLHAQEGRTRRDGSPETPQIYAAAVRTSIAKRPRP